MTNRTLKVAALCCVVILPLTASANAILPRDYYQLWKNSSVDFADSYGSGTEYGNVTYDGNLLVVSATYDRFVKFGTSGFFESSITAVVPMEADGIAGPGYIVWAAGDSSPLMIGTIYDVGWDSFIANISTFDVFDGLQFEITPTFLAPSVANLGTRLGFQTNLQLETNDPVNPWETTWTCGQGPPAASRCLGFFDADALFSLPPVAVPEPATLSLLGVGLLAMFARRRRNASV
jgi:hypothetical protein